MNSSISTNVTSNTGRAEKTLQFCGFKVKNNLYAVSVLDVQEIIKPQKITSVPLSEQQICGLINLRGQIVTVISLRTLFGQKEDMNREYMNVIVRSGDTLSSLVVDEICDVMDVEEDTFEPTPETLDEKLKLLVKGVYKLKDSLLIILDLNRILNC